ncbi:MAG: hypothetical protein MJ168_04140 [Clostridia bacterium]|nr:hypothetical protein [Clostridia bacterium]
MDNLEISTLGHTWLIDLDGTIVKHNGYKMYGKDVLLDGSLEFLNSIPEKDTIIFLTSRKKEFSQITEAFLNENNIRYDRIIYELPYGERILINDNKPSGLQMGYAINKDRDSGLSIEIDENNNL